MAPETIVAVVAQNTKVKYETRKIEICCKLVKISKPGLPIKPRNPHQVRS